MNNVELARTLSWRELEIADTELWAKWKGKTHFWGTKKNTFLFVYDAPMTFQIHFCLTINNHLPSSTTCYLAHLSTREVVEIVNNPLVNATTKSLVNSSICQLVHSSTRQLVHINFVRFSVRILTLWVPFLPTNCPSARKKRFSRRFIWYKNSVGYKYKHGQFVLHKCANYTGCWAI